MIVTIEAVNVGDLKIALAQFSLMLKGNRNPRFLIVLATAGLCLVTAVCGVIFAGFAQSALPAFYRQPPERPPLVWTGLPTPHIVWRQWQSYASTASVRDVAQTADLLWVATDGGLVVHNLTDATAVRFLSEHGLPANSLTAVAATRDGRVWVASRDAGVAEYDGGRWQQFGTANDLPSDAVRDLAVDGAGVVWAATAEGLARYDGTLWTTARSSLLDFSPPDVRALAATPSGLWAATNEGLLFFDGRNWEQFTVQDGLISDNVYAVAITPDGAVWAGTDRGLSRYDGRWERFTVRNGLKQEPIVALAAAADNSVWLAYAEAHGVANFDGTVLRESAVADGLPSNAVQGINVLGGRVWVATAAGLSERVGAGWQTLALPSDFPGGQITDIVEGSEGIWLSSSGGVSQFTGAGWRTFTTADGLTDNRVGALAIDEGGRLHAAFTHPGQGTAVWEDGRWRPNPCVDSGPPLDVLLGGALAPDSSVWLLGERGAARYDGRGVAERWQLFDTGWPADAEPRGLGITPDGIVWAGLKQGLYRLDPADGRWLLTLPEDIFRLSIAPEGNFWLISSAGLQHRVAERFEVVTRPNIPDFESLLATSDGVWISSTDGVARLTTEGWRIYNVGDGLSSRSVTALTQAADGTVWAAYESSKLGFSYFDGGRWQVVHNDYEAVPDGLLSNDVHDILVSPDGSIYFGTEAGLSRYDPNRNAWLTINGIGAVRQVVFAQDAVWVNAANGTARVVGNKLQQEGMMFSQADFLTVAPDGRLWAAELAQSPPRFQVFDGRRWGLVMAPSGIKAVEDMAFGAGGLVWLSGRLDDGTAQLFVTEGKEWQTVRLPTPADLREIEVDAAGLLWVGVFEAEPQVRAFSFGEGVLTAVDALPSLPGLATFALDELGQRWAASGRVGEPATLYRQVGSGWEAAEAPLRTSVRSENAVRALQIAANGDVWLGTAFGAARYVEGRWIAVVASETAAPAAHGGFTLPPKDPVTRIGVTRNAEVWFGTSNGVIGRVSPEGLLPLPKDPLLTWANVRAIVTDRAGGVWIAGLNGRLARYADGGWQRFDGELAAAEVHSLAVVDGRTWLGTNSGLVSIESDRCEYQFYPEPLNTIDLLPAAEGAVWLATTNAGAMMFDGSFDWPVLTLQGRLIRAMAAEESGAVWFAYDNVLVRAEGGDFERLVVDSPLLEGGITALGIGPAARPWVGTARGVLYPDRGEWVALTSRTGLADGRVRQIYPARDGSFWFVTQGGVSHYRP